MTMRAELEPPFAFAVRGHSYLLFVTVTAIKPPARRADAGPVRGRRRFVTVAVMLACFGALTAATVAHQPTLAKPLVDMAGWKPHIDSQIYYCVENASGLAGYCVDERGVRTTIPPTYGNP
jgi:hypothetical protein